MDEYIVAVYMDRKAEQLKTYAPSEFEAMDSMVTLDGVDEVLKIVRTKDNKAWSVDHLNLKKLRELRSLVGSDSDIIEALREKRWN